MRCTTQVDIDLHQAINLTRAVWLMQSLMIQDNGYVSEQRDILAVKEVAGVCLDTVERIREALET